MTKIYTENEISKLVENLRNLSESLYKVGGSVEEKVNDILTEEQKNEFLDFCKNNNLAYLTEQDLDIAIKNFVEWSLKIRGMILTLSFDPTVKFINELKSYIATQVTESVILKMKLDKYILGGVIFEYKGNYIDNSLKDALDKEFSSLEAKKYE